MHGQRGEGRTFKRRIEPRPQIPIGQQIEAEQGREVRETPGPRGLQLQKLQQHHRNQGDPDLHLHRVLTRAHKRLDLEMLLQGLKEQFDLPPLLIDGRDRTGGEMHEVGQEGERPLLRLIPDHHLPQGDGASVGGMQAGQANHLIGQHRATGGHGALLQDLIEHVGARTRDKPHLGAVQR